MENTPKYWKRKGWLSIEGNDHKMHDYGGDVDGLDFKFSGEKIGSIYTRFTAGILGLSWDKINELTVWNVAESMKRKRRIQVFAGYSNDKLANPMFDGFIVDALPTNPPDLWINFNCMRYYDKDEPVVDIRPMRHFKLKEIAKKIADTVGLGWNNKSWRATTLDGDKYRNFYFGTTKAQLIPAFEKQFGVRIMEINEIMVVDDTRPWITHAGEGASTVLSTATGLLALSNISMVGLNAKRRLDDSTRLLDWVGVKSEIIPSVNNEVYVVLKKKHTGHYRGEEWVTELECVRGNAQI